MLPTERIQLQNHDIQLRPEGMNNDKKGKLGDDPFPKVIQNPIYESLEKLPHNENSCDVLRSFQGRMPSPLPVQSSTMPLDPLTVKDKEDTTSIQSKSNDSDYMPMNATNPFYNTDGELHNENGEDEDGNSEY